MPILILWAIVPSCVADVEGEIFKISSDPCTFRHCISVLEQASKILETDPGNNRQMIELPNSLESTCPRFQSENPHQNPRRGALSQQGFLATTDAHMTSQKLKGVISAIPTPVTNSGEIDVAGFMKVAQYLLGNGCDALNVLGTTGEATSFSTSQRMELMSAVKKQGLPMNRLMVGTGVAAVAETITLTRHAAELGFAGALVLPPFYYKNVPDAGVFAFLEKVIGGTEQTPIPIYLYNFPALSGVLYSVTLVKSLITAFPNRMAGLKDSSGDLPYARAVAALSPAFDVFPSNEACLAEARSGIFAGCISATANLNSVDCHKAFHEADDAALARAVAVRKAFDGKPLIPGVKAVLAERLNMPSVGRVMPPLVAASQELMSALAHVREKPTIAT